MNGKKEEKNQMTCRHRFVTRIQRIPLCEKTGIAVNICVKCRYQVVHILAEKGHS